jgi:RNAse (barnase) inhibitor barstar
MPFDISRFTFDGDSIGLDAAKDFAAHVPSGIGTKMSLLNVLKRELRLPEYFGENWDALDECLGDLSWIDRRRVVIVHDDLPRLKRKELVTYMEVLSSAVADWKRGGDHELVVVFPRRFRSELETMAKLD